MTVPLTAGQKSELLLALGDRIDHIRERINRNVALTVNPHRTDGGAKAADRALQWARQQRDAEHAYRNSGGHIDEYLPAVYRDPRATRQPDLGPMRTPERRPGTAGEGTAPASRPSPANLSDRTPEPRTPTSPHEGPARATSVGRNNLSEPDALREAATPDRARDRNPGVASEERLQPCCQAMPTEHHDWCPLVAKVTDRGGPRYISRLGDRRQHPVRCSLCRQPTAALDGLCDTCAVRAAVRAVTHLDHHAKEVMLRG